MTEFGISASVPWLGRGKIRWRAFVLLLGMHARFLKLKHGPELLVRPLSHGDTATVQAVFERLGEASRRALVRSDNRAAFALLSRVLGQFELRIEGPEMLVRAPLPARC